MNTHDAITKTCLDNYYSQRESVVDALKRCTDSMLAGKTVLICGYGQASSDILFLKHACSILRQSSYPVCGFSMMKQFRLCAVWRTKIWLGSSMNHIQ